MHGDGAGEGGLDARRWGGGGGGIGCTEMGWGRRGDWMHGDGVGEEGGLEYPYSNQYTVALSTHTNERIFFCISIIVLFPHAIQTSLLLSFRTCMSHKMHSYIISTIHTAHPNI